MALTPGSKILISDLNLMPRSFASTAARDAYYTANPALRVAGITAVIGSGATMVRYVWDGASWWPWLDWIPYTPGLTNLSIGNGSNVASYMRAGRMVSARGTITLGTTSAMSNLPAIGLPAAAAGSLSNAVGSVVIIDSGTRAYSASALVYAGGSTLGIVLPGTPDFISPSSPMTWVSSDTIVWSITYETAQTAA